MLLIILLIIFSVIVGMVIGLMAQSGSVIIVPFLFTFFGLAFLTAMGTSILVDLISSGIATVVYLYHRKENELDIKLSLILAVFAFVISFFGSYLAFIIVRTSEKGLAILFAIWWVVMGIFLIRNATKSKDESEKTGINKKVMEIVDNFSEKQKLIIVIIVSCFAGIQAGFLAGTGGFLMTVLLLVIYRYEIHKAIGTGLLFMTITALGPTIFYSLIAPTLFPTTIAFSLEEFFQIRWNVYIDYNLVLIIGSIAVIAAFFSSIKAQKLSDKSLKIILGVILIVLNLTMLIQSIVTI